MNSSSSSCNYFNVFASPPTIVICMVGGVFFCFVLWLPFSREPIRPNTPRGFKFGLCLIKFHQHTHTLSRPPVAVSHLLCGMGRCAGWKEVWVLIKVEKIDKNLCSKSQFRTVWFFGDHLISIFLSLPSGTIFALSPSSSSLV